ERASAGCRGEFSKAGDAHANDEDESGGAGEEDGNDGQRRVCAGRGIAERYDGAKDEGDDPANCEDARGEVDFEREADEGDGDEDQSGCMDRKRAEPDEPEDQGDSSEDARDDEARPGKFEDETEEAKGDQYGRDGWVGDEVQQVFPWGHVGRDDWGSDEAVNRHRRVRSHVDGGAVQVLQEVRQRARFKVDDVL